MSSNNKYFIITSHGWSGSNWLAYALNLHPDIICTHSARNIQASEKEMNSDHNLRKNLQSLHIGYLLRQNRKLKESYDFIEALGEAKVYGSVHVYRLRDLPVLYEKYGEFERAFQVMNLVRHPVSLVWSGYGQFKELFRYDLNELHWTSGKVLSTARDFVHRLALKYDLYIGDLENLAFIGAAAVLGSLRLDLDAINKTKKLPKVDFHGHVPMEKITKEPNILKDVVKILSKDALHAEALYLDQVFNAGVVNEHKNDANKHNAELRYSQFTDWQKETFNYFFNLYNLQESYREMGYNFSFLTK